MRNLLRNWFTKATGRFIPASHRYRGRHRPDTLA